MPFVLFQRQVVDAARADDRARLRAKDGPAGMLLKKPAVISRLVVEAGQIDLIGQAVSNRAGRLIEAGSDRASRIVLVTNIGEHFCGLPTVGPVLLWNLVADTPHDDAGVISIAAEHVR